MLAQSLVEYSLVSSLAQTLQRGRVAVESWLGSLSTAEWAVIAAMVVVALGVRSLRRSR